MVKFKTSFQVLVVLMMLFSVVGTYQQAQAQSSTVVVVRDFTYWDAVYTGYVDVNRYEKWPLMFTDVENFSVTALPDAEGLTTLIILTDATGTELARGTGALTSSQPAGNYYVQIQPETGNGFYDLTIRRVDVATTEPSSTTIAQPADVLVGETATVSVGLDNVPAEGYTSAEFTCTYDMSLVEVSNIVMTDLFGADSVSALNGPVNGSFILAIAGTNGNRAMADGVAFTFAAKGLLAGDATISCVARVSKGDNLLAELPATSANLKITNEVAVEEGTLTGQVFAGKAVTVTLYDSTDASVTSVSANADGTFSITAPVGTYTVLASANGFLSVEGSATLSADATSTMPVVTLLAGDINSDDVVDQFDAITIGMNYNNADPSAADLNNDGVINVLDLELLAANYRLTGPIDWQ